MTRTEKLMPNGVPRYVRCYDNGGETADRYTVCFTKKRVNVGCFPPPYHRGQFWSLCMSTYPFHPCGVGMHGEHEELIDRPNYKHLGKKIKFTDLPADCQTLAKSTYVDIWDIDTQPELDLK